MFFKGRENFFNFLSSKFRLFSVDKCGEIYTGKAIYKGKVEEGGEGGRRGVRWEKGEGKGIYIFFL